MKLIRSLILWLFFWLYIFLTIPILLIISIFLKSQNSRDTLIQKYNASILHLIQITPRIHSVYADSTFPVIFVANHISFFDLFISGATLPGYPRGFELHTHFHMPFYGWFIKAFGQIPLNPKNRTSINHSMHLAKNMLARKERNFFIMPEGSRSRDGKLKKFSHGASYLSILTSTPIVPVVYTNLFAINNPNSLLITPQILDIHIGPLIYPENFESKEAMTTYVYNYMADILNKDHHEN